MNLARQNDPELFTRVEREQRSGNLERMRTNYVKQVNSEIATKNREHGINNLNIDVNELSKREKPIARTNEMKPSNTRTSPGNRGRVQSENKDKRTGVSVEQERVQTPSRIQKESKSPSRASVPGRVDAQRVEPANKQKERSSPSRVEQSRKVPEVETKAPDRKEAKNEKPRTDSRKSTPSSQRPQNRQPSVSRNPREERFYSTENVR